MIQWFMHYSQNSLFGKGTLRASGVLMGVLLLCAIAACTPTQPSTGSQPNPQQSSEPSPSISPSPPTSQKSPEDTTGTGSGTEPNTEDTLCAEPQTQLAMNQCSRQAYEQADATLNQTYESIRTQLPVSGQQNLTDAELAWISFRDLECEFAKEQYSGGSIAPLIYNGCLESLTTLRTEEIAAPQRSQTSYEAADTQLNQAYQSLLAQLSESRSQAFIDAQLAWIDYRDLNCEFEVSYAAVPIEESQCLARMSETRTEQILDTLEQNSL